MLIKSSPTPQGRMLSLFDILDDWINVPQLNAEIFHQGLFTKTEAEPLLVAYLTEQGKACGAFHPNILAEHLVLIARSAAQQAINQPYSHSLAHAKKAAHALILAQTPTNRSIVSRLNSLKVYGIAASLAFMISAVSIILPLVKHSHPTHVNVVQARIRSLTTRTPNNLEPLTGVTSDDAIKIYAKYEQMRNGACQFPEVLQIPDKDKAIYLEDVVGGKLPNDTGDLAIAKFYLEKVRCNYTPMLMEHSK